MNSFRITLGQHKVLFLAAALVVVFLVLPTHAWALASVH
jgi:hypothetical protein